MAPQSWGEGTFRIGIAWQGNPANREDRFRSFAIEQFEPLARQPGVTLYSLQSGPGREQVARVAERWPIVDLGDRLGDFLNMAAIVRQLDLVITCDSAPAHLAGSLGVPDLGSPDARGRLAVAARPGDKPLVSVSSLVSPAKAQGTGAKFFSGWLKRWRASCNAP